MKQPARALFIHKGWFALALFFFPGLLFKGWEASLPESAYIDGVPGHAQSYNLSCESRSAVDWAAFWGVEISESEFLSKLPRSDNPDKGFVGQPNGPWGFTPPNSYGVHARPVAKLLRVYGLQAKAEHGLKWKHLQAEIAAGRQVIVWLIGQVWPGAPRSYTDARGETTTVAPYEHTMLLIGYDVALAARFGTHWTAIVELNAIPYPYTLYQGQVLRLPDRTETGSDPPAVEEPASPSEAEEPEVVPEGETYIVQPGDFLKKVADRFG